MAGKIIIPDELIINKIYLIREQKIMLDSDLAELYGVETKRLKEQVRRNIDRFPQNFMFELTAKEHVSLRSQIATIEKGRYSRYLPFAFTEYGILMLSSVLKSDKAIVMSIHIIETFVQLRKFTNNFEAIRNKIQKMESQNKKQFGEIFEILERLLEHPNQKQRSKIGFKR